MPATTSLTFPKEWVWNHPEIDQVTEPKDACSPLLQVQAYQTLFLSKSNLVISPLGIQGVLSHLKIHCDTDNHLPVHKK